MTTRQRFLNQSLSQPRNQNSIRNHYSIADHEVLQKSQNNFNHTTNNSFDPSVLTVTNMSITSLIFFFRRSSVAFFLPPMLLTLAPPLGSLIYVIISYLSSGHFLSVTCIALVFREYIRQQITRCAPTEKKAQKALHQCSISLPLFAIVVTSLISQFFASLGLISTYEGNNLQTFAGACGLGAYLGFMGFTLNLLVLFRFVGPFSIVKCSNTPLQPNPYDFTLTKISSIDGIQELLRKMTSPSYETAFPKQTFLVKEVFQKPTLIRATLQIFFHFVVGYVFSSLLPKPGLIISITTIMTCTWNVIKVALTDNNHEIDIRRYPSIRDSNSISYVIQWLMKQTLQSMKNETFSYRIIIAIFLSLLAHRENSDWLTRLTLPMMINFFLSILFSVFVSFACAAYLTLSDRTLRLFLSQKIIHTDALFSNLRHSPNSSKNTFMTQFLIQTILQNSYITKQIMTSSSSQSPTSQSGYSSSIFPIQQENQARQIRELTKIMAQFLQSSLFTPLAEEMLRINMLATLSLPSYSSDSTQEEIMFHFTSLLKSLCIYLGGLGEALSNPTISVYDTNLPHENIKPSFKSEKVVKDTWISYGATVQATFAVNAMMRILSSTKLAKNSCYISHIHLHLPSILENLYILHKGVLAYANAKMKIEMQKNTSMLVAGISTVSHDKEAILNRFIAVQFPELKVVMRTCEDTAKKVISEEGVVEEWRQSRLLGDGCKNWLNSLMID